MLLKAALVALSGLLPCAPALEALKAEHADRMAHRALVCVDVAREASDQGIDPWLAVAVAWTESRLIDGAYNRTVGASGPLQAVPKFWCPGGVREGCDLTAAGVRALVKYTSRYGLSEGLARYAGGNNPGPVARGYSATVQRRVKRWKRRARRFFRR